MSATNDKPGSEVPAGPEASRSFETAVIPDLRKFRHDARNQLNLIVGYMELLNRPSVGTLNEKQKIYVDRARAASETLERLVDELLASVTEADQA